MKAQRIKSPKLFRTAVPVMVTGLLAMAVVESAGAEPPVEVMILGSYHMGNPGQDVHNAKADDVTTPANQAELETISEALAAFAPTVVAVERVSQRNDLTLEAYEEFKPADLQTERSETVQIGYRLAHNLDHEAVYGIDEQDDAIDYFPYGKLKAYLKETGQENRLEHSDAQAKALVGAMERNQADAGIARTLVWLNEPTLIRRMQRNWYYDKLEIGDAEQQPGALVNGRYYLRNAKIFTKLALATEPGDRAVVVYGSGHAYWLRHLVKETPGYRLVEPNPWLEVAIRP